MIDHTQLIQRALGFVRSLGGLGAGGQRSAAAAALPWPAWATVDLGVAARRWLASWAGSNSAERVGALIEEAMSARVRAKGEAAHRLVQDLFELEEIAARCLARHWAERNGTERTEFVRLLTGLLARGYFGKLRRAESVRTDTATVREHFASVHCRLIAADGAETRLEHRLRLSAGRWRIYDFLVDGVSFVNSYREHVDRIITATSYQDLVWRLQLKGLENGPVAWPDR